MTQRQPRAGEGSSARVLPSERLVRDARKFVRLRVRLFLLLPCLGALAALALELAQPRIYQAHGRVEMVSTVFPHKIAKRQFNTLLVLLRTDPSLELVVKQLSADARARLRGGPAGKHARSSKDPDAGLRARIRSGLQVETAGPVEAEGAGTDWRNPLESHAPGQPGSILDIYFVDADPDLAAEVVNAFMRAAEFANMRVAVASATQTKVFFKQRLAVLSERIGQEERQRNPSDMDRLQEQETGAAPGLRRDKLLRRPAGPAPEKGRVSMTLDLSVDDQGILLRKLLDELLNARLGEGQAKARAGLLAGMNASQLEAAGDESPMMLRARMGLAIAQARYADLSATLGPNEPQMQTEKAKIANLQAQTLAAGKAMQQDAEQQVQAAEATVASLRTQVQAAQANVQRTLTAKANDATDDRNLALDVDLYENVQQLLESLRIEPPLGERVLETVDEATPPEEPVPLRLRGVTAVGGAAGLLLALGIFCFLKIRYRNRWTVGELEELLERQVAAVMPLAPRAAGKGRRVVRDRGWDEPIEALEDSLQVWTLMEELRCEPCIRTVLLTSSQAGEGNSTAVSNLARLLACKGHRVLAIDLNLRRPTLSHRFGMDRRPGLTHVLHGSVPLDEAVQPIAWAPGLDVLASGPPPSSAADLLASNAMGSLLGQAAARYDYVLLDAPPLESQSVGTLVGARVDAVYLVARYGVISQSNIARSVLMLDRAQIALYGLVVTGAPAS